MAFNPDLFGVNFLHEMEQGLNYFGDLGGGTDIITVTPQLRRYVQGNVRYWKKKGVRRFRVFTPDWSWAGRTDYMKVFVELVMQEGDVHVEWGVGPNGMTSTLDGFLNNVDQHVIWFHGKLLQYADRGVTGVWITANELEFMNAADVNSTTAVSMTRTSNVITVVLNVNLHLAVGDRMSITSSLTGSGHFSNITSVPNPYTFTFSHSGSDATQSGGTVSFTPYSKRQQVKRWVDHWIDDLGLNMDYSYSCAQGAESGDGVSTGYFFTRGWKEPGAFPQIGKGKLRFVDLNEYGLGGSSTPEQNWTRWKIQVDAAIADIGAENLRITEWNMHNNDDTNPTFNNNLLRRSELLVRRRRYLELKGIPHYFFASKMGSYLGEMFPIYSNIDQMARPSTYRLLEQKSPIVEIRPL